MVLEGSDKVLSGKGRDIKESDHSYSIHRHLPPRKIISSDLHVHV